MQLAYVDDSGDSRKGVVLSVLLVRDRDWNGVLDAWLDGRRAIHREFRVPKTRELHANTLYKGRGDYCDDDEASKRFGQDKRDAVGRIMLSALAKAEGLQIASFVVLTRRTAEAYSKLVDWLDAWAACEDETIMIFYDGRQLGVDDGIRTPVQLQEDWEQAMRSAAPYRDVHRRLDIRSRRIVEDVFLQDSKYNQLIQAADLVAYGAFQLHRQRHPEMWGTGGAPVAGAIRAYKKLKDLWVPGGEEGIFTLT